MAKRKHKYSPVECAALAELDRAKHCWRDQVMSDLNQVMSDLRLTTTAYVLAYWLADRFTLKDTMRRYMASPDNVIEFWGSQKNMAKGLGRDASTISDAVQALIDHGHMACKLASLGRGYSNRYQIVLKPIPSGGWNPLRPEPSQAATRL